MSDALLKHLGVGLYDRGPPTSNGFLPDSDDRPPIRLGQRRIAPAPPPAQDPDEVDYQRLARGKPNIIRRSALDAALTHIVRCFRNSTILSVNHQTQAREWVDNFRRENWLYLNWYLLRSEAPHIVWRLFEHVPLDYKRTRRLRKPMVVSDCFPQESVLDEIAGKERDHIALQAEGPSHVGPHRATANSAYTPANRAAVSAQYVLLSQPIVPTQRYDTALDPFGFANFDATRLAVPHLAVPYGHSFSTAANGNSEHPAHPSAGFF
ncbi:hypothetical protein JCM16303_000761 [Sporobolomyces ruberrimus]